MSQRISFSTARSHFFRAFLLAGLTAASFLAVNSAYSQNVDVQGAWARATVPGQKASGAFMKLTASSDTQLVSASTPAAGVTEIHEMKMEGNTMSMRPLEGGLVLPAGKIVALAPGGYHVMLMDLKQQLTKGSKIALTLTFRTNGNQTTQEIQVPVLSEAPGGGHDHMSGMN